MVDRFNYCSSQCFHEERRSGVIGHIVYGKKLNLYKEVYIALFGTVGDAFTYTLLAKRSCA